MRARRRTRDRFLAGRIIVAIDDGNHAVAKFIAEIAHARPHPTIAQRSVGDVFADERARLLGLPEPLPETDRVEPIQVDSQGFVRIDTNRYSVPSIHAGHVHTIVVSDRTVRVVDGTTVLAEHTRSWG